MQASEYRYEATSVAGFLSQLVRYIQGGHYFYFACTLPPDADPQAVDRKLLALYDVVQPRWKRKTRSRGDRPSVHYLRHERFYVLLSTHGREEVGGEVRPGRLFVDHSKTIRDVRRTALKFRGYSVRYTYSETHKRWKVFVRLDREAYRAIRTSMTSAATRARYRQPAVLEHEFAKLALEPYGPVRKQLLAILKEVNRLRRRAGLSQINSRCIRRMRSRPVKVFFDATEPISQSPFHHSQSRGELCSPGAITRGLHYS